MRRCDDDDDAVQRDVFSLPAAAEESSLVRVIPLLYHCQTLGNYNDAKLL